LWQRLKSLDEAPQVCLSGVVRAMQQLGKPAPEILAELRSAIECNAAFVDGLVGLLEDVRRTGERELSEGTACLLQEAGRVVPEEASRPQQPPRAKSNRAPAAQSRSSARQMPSVGAEQVEGASVEPCQAAPAPSAEETVDKHIATIKALGRQRDLHGAVRAFDKLKQSGAPMNPLIYNCLLDACLQCDDLASAKTHFAQMKQLDYVDIVSYNSMLKAHIRAWRVEEAELLLREMLERGLPANMVTYNELLGAKVAAKDRRGVWRLIDDMKRAGVSPNAASCSVLLKALTEHSHTSDVSRTVELLDQMEEPVDEVLFGVVSEVCIRMRRLDLLADLRKKYAKKGSTLSLTAPAYGSMIKAYGQAGNMGQLWELWEEMKQREVLPTAITVGCMIDSLVKNGAVEDAWRLLHELLQDEDRKASVNTVIYSTVLKGFATSKQMNKITLVYKEMRDRGVPLNTITYNTILDACARCGSMDRVPKLLEEMRASNVEPDIITYSTIVKGYCHSGDVDRAFQVLEEMKRDAVFTPDEILYNSLLDGCARQSRVDEALRLLEDMKTSGVTPSNYTLSILVKLLGRSRRLNQAFAVVEDLCAVNGFSPNVQVYTCLIQACIQNRKIDRAVALHDTMITEAGCHPDQKLYSVLLRGCVQSGASEQAVRVIRCAYNLAGHGMATLPKRGSPPGVEAPLLDEALSKFNSVTSVKELVTDLKEQRNISVSQRYGSSPNGQSRSSARSW